MKFKVGDKLYCHTPIGDTVAGEYYTLSKYKQHVSILANSEGEICGFDPKKYKDNYYTIKELRLIKLEKLKKQSIRDFVSNIQNYFLMPKI